MKKLFALLLTLCLILSVTSSVAETLQAEEGATIKIMGGAHLVSTLEIVMKKFIEEHPEITVEFEKYSFSEYPTKMKLQFSQNEPVPDIALCHAQFFTPFMDAGYFKPLNDIIKAEDYLPSMLAAATKDGSIYGVPNQGTNQMCFIYREDIYNELGLTPPTTFDEYYEQGLLLKEKGYYIGAFDPMDGPASTFIEFMLMLGGEMQTKDGEIVFTKGKEALDLMQKCIDAGIWHRSNAANSQDFWNGWNSGEIAAIPALGFHPAYFMSNVDPAGNGGYGKLAIAPMFTFSEDGPASVILDTQFYAINARTLYPKAAQMVFEYICANTDATMAFSDVNENGIVARFGNAYIPGLERLVKEGSTGWDVFGGKQVVSFQAEDLLNTQAQLRYINEYTVEIEGIVNEVLGEMFDTGAYTPDEAVQEMLDRCESDL